MNIQSFPEFQQKLANSPELQEEFKKDPVKAVQQFEQQPIPNTGLYKIVVSSLGLSIILVIISVCILSMQARNMDSTVSTLFTAISSGAVGALAGLLSPTQRG